MKNRTQALVVLTFLLFCFITAEIGTPAKVDSEIAKEDVTDASKVLPTAGIGNVTLYGSEPGLCGAGVSNAFFGLSLTIEANEKLLEQASFQGADVGQNGSSEVLQESEDKIVEEVYYVLDEEEFDLLCKLIYAEFNTESFMAKVYGANVTINNAIYNNKTVKKEIFTKGRYSTVRNGVIGNPQKDGSFRVTTDEDITDEIREAVFMAQEKDYTLEKLKEIAEELGLDESYYEGGARYYYASKGLTDKAKKSRENIKVRFKCDKTIFYAAWK